MKQLFFVLTAAALCTSCKNNSGNDNSKRLNTDLIAQNLKGEVKSLTETSKIIDSAGNQKSDSIIGVMEFDDKGYQSKYYQKDSAGKVHLDQSISHNDNGTMKEFVSKKDGKQNMRIVTESDDKGSYTGGKSYDSTNKQDGYYKDLKTNEYGEVYAGKHYNMNNKLKETWDYKFNKGNFIGGSATDSTGKTSYQGTVTLNDKGDPQEDISTTRQKDSTKTEKTTYKYDSYDNKGNWTQRTSFNEKEKPTKITKRTITYYTAGSQ